MDKFEYRVESLSTLSSMTDNGSFLKSRGDFNFEYLNDLGDEGWEVCAVDGNKYLLKRVKKE